MFWARVSNKQNYDNMTSVIIKSYYLPAGTKRCSSGHFLMCPIWNVIKMECAPFGMWYKWNVSFLECDLIEMCHFWIVLFLECDQNGMCFFEMCSFWNILFLECVFNWMWQKMECDKKWNGTKMIETKLILDVIFVEYTIF